MRLTVPPSQDCVWKALLSSLPLPLIVASCTHGNVSPKPSSTEHHNFADVHGYWGCGNSILQIGQGSSLSRASPNQFQRFLGVRLDVVLQIHFASSLQEVKDPERTCSKEASFVLFSSGFPFPHPRSSCQYLVAGMFCRTFGKHWI